jgi:hypothetical protein
MRHLLFRSDSLWKEKKRSSAYRSGLVLGYGKYSRPVGVLTLWPPASTMTAQAASAAAAPRPTGNFPAASIVNLSVPRRQNTKRKIIPHDHCEAHSNKNQARMCDALSRSSKTLISYIVTKTTTGAVITHRKAGLSAEFDRQVRREREREIQIFR